MCADVRVGDRCVYLLKCVSLCGLAVLGLDTFSFNYVHCMHLIFLVDICVQSALCLARNNVLLYSAGCLMSG